MIRRLEGMGLPRALALFSAVCVVLAITDVAWPTEDGWYGVAGAVVLAAALAWLAYRMQAAVHDRRRMERRLARKGVTVPRNVRKASRPPALDDIYLPIVRRVQLPPRVSDDPLTSVAAVVLATPDERVRA